MPFNDDLNADLSNVFFADFQSRALINGVEVVGFLDINAHRWADISSEQMIFMVPRSNVPPIQRGATITINGKPYTLVRPLPAGDQTHLVVSA